LHLASASHRPSVSAGDTIFTWPLTGRAEELQFMAAALSAPDCSGVVLRGSSGVGKTRIAREALSAAAAHGSEVRWAVATSSARDIPLGAFAVWVGPDTDAVQLARGVIAGLTSARAGATVIVGIDDAQLLDELSVFVLHQIVQLGAAKLVLTLRDGAQVPAGLQQLWEMGTFDKLDLQPLSAGETATLVSAALGGPLHPDTAERLWQLTRGNALYLRDIVDQEVAERRLVRADGGWRWSGDPVLPASLIDAIESRIGALRAPISEVIDALAIGGSMELDSLRSIVDPAALEEADGRGLIVLDRVDSDVQVRLAHPLYGEVRRRRAATTRLRRLHGLVATALADANHGDDVPMVVRRALLSLDSDLDRDAGFLLRAAQGAVWLMDLPTALRLADAAIRAGGGAEAVFVYAHALSWLGRGREADTVLADMHANELTDGQAARLTFLRAANTLFALADPAGAKQLVDAAPASPSPQALSSHAAIQTVYSASMGQPEIACAAAKDIVWDQLDDPVANQLAIWAVTVAAGGAGLTADAERAAERGYDTAIRSFVVITDAHVDALLLAGRIADAVSRSDFLHGRAADVEGPVWIPRGSSEAVAGRVALGAGELDTACALLTPVVEMLGAETNGWGYRCRLAYTTAVAMRGCTDQALAALKALQAQRHPGWRYLDYQYAIARAWVAACQGSVTTTRELLHAAAETCCANGQFAAEVMCLQTAVQFGDRSRGPRLRELAAFIEGPRAGLAARFAEALTGDDAAELEAVSVEFEQMGDRIAAVDAAAHAALAFRRAALRGSASRCSTRADALAVCCGGASTPALQRASEQLPFTERELEVVMHVGQGLSNAAIAKRLTLSARTVEGHIYRAMIKTDTSSREELAALLRQRKPDTGQ